MREKTKERKGPSLRTLQRIYKEVVRANRSRYVPHVGDKQIAKLEKKGLEQ